MSFSLAPQRLLAAEKRRTSAGAEETARAAGQSEERADARLVDPHRRERRDHGLHRQGGARAGHQDRAHPGRGRGARRRAALDHARHRRHRAHAERRATPPAASRCRTAGPRSCTPPRRCAAILVGTRGAAPRRSARGAHRASRRRSARRTAAASPTASSSRARRCTCRRRRNRRCAIRRRAASSASRCSASTSRRKSPAARSTCRTCGCPDMVHARVVRPPSYGARLAVGRQRTRAEDARRAEDRAQRQLPRGGRRARIPGGRRDARARDSAAKWEERATLPPPAELVRSLPAPARRRTTSTSAARPKSRSGPGAITATYRRPYQMHASIGPSCAVALAAGRRAHGLVAHAGRLSAARRDRRDAARAARARARASTWKARAATATTAPTTRAPTPRSSRRRFPGRPVRVQWMREDEHTWEPYGSVMISTVRAKLDGANVVDWQYEVWSNTHNDASRARRASRAGVAHRAAVHAAAAEADAAAHGRRQPQRDSAVHVPEHARRPPLRAGDAAARLGAARARRLSQRVRDRELHGRARARREGRPGRFPAAPPRRLARDATSSAPRAERFGWAQYRRGSADADAASAIARYKNLAAYCAVAIEVEVGPRKRLRAAASRGRRDRQRRSGQSGRHPQPDRRRHHPVDQLDALRGGDVRYDAHHEPRLEHLPDPALLQRARQRRRARHHRGPACLSSAPAKRRRVRPPPRSRTPSPMRSACASASCRSRAHA